MCRFDLTPISSKSTLALMVSFVFPAILSNFPIGFPQMLSRCASHQGYVTTSEMTNKASPTNKPSCFLFFPWSRGCFLV
jgi:hypothetical protein